MSLAALPSTSRRTLRPGEKIRVLIVDDSVVIRRLVTHALEQDPWLEVAGTASNGRFALSRIAQLRPDVVTLDVEMPEMNGLEALRHLKRSGLQTKVIMFSTLTERGAAVTLEALSLGAADYVNKASNDGDLDKSLERLRRELIPKIKQFFRFPAESLKSPAPVLAPRTRILKPQAVAIGVSTGGPAALDQLIPRLRADFPLPVLIVQHMPPTFTRLLAERLDSASRLRVQEAREDALIEPGHVWIAPGDYHMRTVLRGGQVRIALDQSAPRNSCRPAADALFESLAKTYGGAVLTVVLTGMGSDGRTGAALLRSLGASVLAQDEESSVVWGMPGAVVQAGLADAVVPLSSIAQEIERRISA